MQYITTNYDNALDLMADGKVIEEISFEDTAVGKNKIKEEMSGQVFQYKLIKVI